MTGLITLILALLILYILSRLLINKLFYALLRLTKSREKASNLLGWIFLPGTFIHEVAHFITALFLVVPVGKMNLLTETDGNEIRLGSVQIGKTDFLRGSIIGLAPILLGGGLIMWGISFATSNNNYLNPWITVILIYLIFQVTHTMFSSKTDLKAVLELVVFLIIVSGVLYYFKILAPFEFLFAKIQSVNSTSEKLSLFLGIPIALEIIFLLV